MSMADIDVAPTQRRHRFTSTTNCCKLSTLGKKVSDSQCYLKKKLNANFFRRFFENIRRAPSSPVRHVESTQTIVSQLDARPDSPTSWIWPDSVTGMRVVESSATIITEIDVEISEDIEDVNGNGIEETAESAEEIIRIDGSSTEKVLCKLCLGEAYESQTIVLETCKCTFCVECMCQYVSYSISSGFCEISCPDGDCPAEFGALTHKEIDSLVTEDLTPLLERLRVNLEVDRDPTRTWCPNAGCETICDVPQDVSPLRPVDSWNKPVAHVHCSTCSFDFCSSCKEPWHEASTCNEDPLMERQGLVKRCPFCKVPIERDSGCAQMMCRRCKHVFCWYCLVSLDDDFMLRHYDRGPCRDKLGHTKLSLLWHRLQVVAVFLGFGIVFIVTSPLLLVVSPCVFIYRQHKKKTGGDAVDGIVKKSRYFF